jgi:hypothetical protein
MAERDPGASPRGQPRAPRAWLAPPALLLFALAACRGSPVEPCPTAQIAVQRLRPTAMPAPPASLDSLFRAAGAEFQVPPGVLASVAWVETRWQMVRGAEEFPGRPPAFGVMALRGAALERGAALAGVTPEAARYDTAANIRAGAAVLRAYAADAADDWDNAAARFSGIEVAEGRAAYLGAVGRRDAPGGGQPLPWPPPPARRLPTPRLTTRRQSGGRHPTSTSVRRTPRACRTW